MRIGSVAIVMYITGGLIAIFTLPLSLLYGVVNLVHVYSYYSWPPHENEGNESSRNTLHKSADKPVNIIEYAVGCKVGDVTLIDIVIIFILENVTHNQNCILRYEKDYHRKQCAHSFILLFDLQNSKGVERITFIAHAILHAFVTFCLDFNILL